MSLVCCWCRSETNRCLVTSSREKVIASDFVFFLWGFSGLPFPTTSISVSPLSLAGVLTDHMAPFMSQKLLAISLSRSEWHAPRRHVMFQKENREGMGSTLPVQPSISASLHWVMCPDLSQELLLGWDNGSTSARIKGTETHLTGSGRTQLERLFCLQNCFFIDNENKRHEDEHFSHINAYV